MMRRTPCSRSSGKSRAQNAAWVAGSSALLLLLRTLGPSRDGTAKDFATVEDRASTSSELALDDLCGSGG